MKIPKYPKPAKTPSRFVLVHILARLRREQMRRMNEATEKRRAEISGLQVRDMSDDDDPKGDEPTLVSDPPGK